MFINARLQSIFCVFVCDFRLICTWQFERGKNWVAKELDLDANVHVSVFESTIRVIGGLLSAHHLSGDPIFLTQARRLGEKLSVAFDTASGLPRTDVNLKTLQATTPHWSSGVVGLAEAGSLQLEWLYLARETGNATFGRLVQRVTDQVSNVQNDANIRIRGLFPVLVRIEEKQVRFL